MATALHRLGRAAFRHRAIVLAVWLVALVGLGAGAFTLSGVVKSLNFSVGYHG